MAQADHRIKLFRGEHAGVSAARNIALDRATGEYVFFLDSDDVIYPLLFETYVNAMCQTDAQMAGTHVVNVSQVHWQRVVDKLAQEPVPTQVVCLDNRKTMEVVFSGNSVFSCIGGVMIKRSLIGQTRFRQDLFIGEDFFFVYENLIKGPRCVEITDRWYYVRHHKTNSSWSYGYDGFWTRFHRRELVWRSEEALGRKAYADIEKRSAFGCFLKCFKRNNPKSEDNKKMRHTIWSYRKELLPVLTPKAKILFITARVSPTLLGWLLKKKN